MHFDAMTGWERVDPRRQHNANLPHGKFVQHSLEHGAHFLGIDVHAVRGNGGDVVGIGNLLTNMLRFRALRLHRIDQNEKWFVQAFQLANHAILRVQIRFARKIRYSTVGCHDKANGGVVGNDLSRAQLGSLRHGNGGVAPWCRDHARRVLLGLPECAVNEIADAIHQSNLACPIIVQRNFCGFFRHKFRLRGHDGSAGT